MKRVMQIGVLAVFTMQAVAVAQGQDVGAVMASVRAALGGESKLAQVKTVSIEGKSSRVRPDGTSASQPVEIYLELPDKYSRRDVVGNINGAEIARTAGFNGEALVEQTEMPPQMGGGMMIMRAGPGMQVSGPGGAATNPEQAARVRAASLTGARHDFARLTLGMFGASLPAYPLEMSYAGLAESPDGKAHVIDVKGAGDFAAKLFVDTATNLPLMLSWMAKEPMPPMQMTMGPGGPQMTMGSGAQVQRGGGSGGGTPTHVTPEDMAKIQADMEARIKEAEAKRRVVEYRLFYSDYKSYDGVKFPSRMQRMIEGKPTEEIEFDRVRVNGKIDPKKFEIAK